MRWLLLGLALAVACVSKRERRQLAYAAQTDSFMQHDSSWWTGREAAVTLRLLELEEWRDNADTVPPEASFRRLRLLTAHSGSSASTAGATAARDSQYTSRAVQRTDVMTRKPANLLRYVGFAAIACAAIGLGCRFIGRR